MIKSGQMFDQVLVGCAASLFNLILHAILIAFLVWTVRYVRARDMGIPEFLQYTAIIVAAGGLLVIAHFSEVMVWAYTYAWVEAAAPEADFVYLAFGNYTTLGYDDVKLAESWQLLGPLSALNGIMLIGWSTALIIEILRRGGHGGAAPQADGPSQS